MADDVTVDADENTPPPVSWEARAQHANSLLNGLLTKLYELGKLLGHDRVGNHCTCGWAGDIGEPYSGHLADVFESAFHELNAIREEIGDGILSRLDEL